MPFKIQKPEKSEDPFIDDLDSMTIEEIRQESKRDCKAKETESF